MINNKALNGLLMSIGTLLVTVVFSTIIIAPLSLVALSKYKKKTILLFLTVLVAGLCIRSLYEAKNPEAFITLFNDSK